MKCPFCGELPEIQQKYDRAYVIICTGCKCQTKHFIKKEEAVESWNHRFHELSEPYFGELFGARISRIRKSYHIMQRKLADDIKIPYSVLIGIEDGRMQHEIDMLISIADYFGVSLDYLVRGFRKGE